MPNGVASIGGVDAPGIHRDRGTRAWLRRVAGVVRTVMGAPDYERYVTHMHEHHPGCDVASQDEFLRQRLESRYSKPGARCC